MVTCFIENNKKKNLFFVKMDDQSLMTNSMKNLHTHTKRKTAVKYIKNCSGNDKKHNVTIEVQHFSV